MAEGVIVFNRRGGITYISRAAQRLLGVDERMDYARLREYLSCFGAQVDEAFESAEVVLDGRTLSLSRYLNRDEKGAVLAFTVIVSDITKYCELIDRTNELAAAQQRLAIEQERNRIAQEVHDTAGHTLTMISSLARLSQVSLGKLENADGSSELDEYLREMESLSRSGITQLRCSINNLRDGTFLTSVVGGINALVGAVRDMEIDFCIQGEEDDRYGFCTRAVYDSCRELITNCVRYASASRMDIILKFTEASLELYVFDNGKGCAEIKRSNGLRGIAQRIEALGGTAVFNSSEGNGFGTVIKIPIKEAG
jgi:signal transduction histidine kinase